MFLPFFALGSVVAVFFFAGVYTGVLAAINKERAIRHKDSINPDQVRIDKMNFDVKFYSLLSVFWFTASFAVAAFGISNL